MGFIIMRKISRDSTDESMRADAVATALVVAIGSLIQAMPDQARDNAQAIIRACLRSGIVDDPQAEQLLSGMADT
jgi:hypothetical protein